MESIPEAACESGGMPKFMEISTEMCFVYYINMSTFRLDTPENFTPSTISLFSKVLTTASLAKENHSSSMIRYAVTRPGFFQIELLVNFRGRSILTYFKGGSPRQKIVGYSQHPFPKRSNVDL